MFTAIRAYADREFLASTDNWFRPVHLSIGPDGAIYVLDFYREVIETPLSLPDDIKQQLNLESRGRGRIWRIAPRDFQPSKLPDLTQMKPDQLAAELTSANRWRRITAQQLIVEKQQKAVVPNIRELLAKSRGTPGLASSLWTLSGLGALKPADVEVAFRDSEAGNREQALRLSESFFADSPELRKLAASLMDDPSPRVRFQLAFSAGTLPPAEAAPILAALLKKDAGDRWTVAAALSSASACGLDLLHALTKDRKPDAANVSRLAAMIGAAGEAKQIARVLELVAEGRAAGSEPALLEGLGRGMRGSKSPLTSWWARPPAEAVEVMPRLRKRFDSVAVLAHNQKAGSAARVHAIALLAFGPSDAAVPLADLLTPTTPGDVQIAAVRALSAHSDALVSELILKKWGSYGPALRREAMDAMLARARTILKLLDAVAAKKVASSEFTLVQVQQLQNHLNPTVRKRAAALFKRSNAIVSGSSRITRRRLD